MKSESVILCLDVGTSACKGALVDFEGRVRGLHRIEYSVLRHSDGCRVEQEALELWEAVRNVVRRLVSAAGKCPIAAISLSAQMSSHMLVDARGRPLTRFITWADRRAEVESRAFAAAFSREERWNLFGAHLTPGPSWPVPKLKWWKEHEPKVFARAKHLVQPKDWILWKLCGVWVSDVSSLRGICHQESSHVNPQLAAWAGFDPALIPDRVAPDSVAGTSSAATVHELGLSAQIPVIVGWNDLAAGVVGGCGLSDYAIGVDLTGTSEHLGVLLPNAAIPAKACTLNEIPVSATHRLRYGVTNSSGAVLQWYLEKFRCLNCDASGYAKLEEELGEVEPGAGGLLFMPTLDGERAPWPNPRATGAFFGVRPTHNARDFSCAVIEGISFILRSILGRLGSEMPGEFRVIGGASAMTAWNQRKADIFQIPFVTLEMPEAGCLGAAILAGKALGWYATLPASAQAMVRTARRFDPDPKRGPLFALQHERFEALYRALEPMYGGST